MNKNLARVTQVILCLAILAPAVVLAPVLGVVDLGIEVVVLIGVLLLLGHVSWPLKIVLVLFATMFFVIPPVPNYLLVSDKGVSLQWIGLANVFRDPLPILERLAFYGLCWLGLAKLSQRRSA